MIWILLVIGYLVFNSMNFSTYWFVRDQPRAKLVFWCGFLGVYDDEYDVLFIGPIEVKPQYFFTIMGK